MGTANWTAERLTALLTHEDEDVANWALERLALEYDEEPELAEAALIALSQEALAERALELLETVLEDAEEGLREAIGELEDDEIRDRARVLLATRDPEAAAELADSIISNPPDHAETLWEELTRLAPDVVRDLLAERYSDDLISEQPWLLVAWLHIAPPDATPAMLDAIDDLDDDEDEELAAWFAEAAYAYLRRLGAERLIEIDIDAEDFVDRMRSATKQGTWALQDLLAKRLEDDDFPVQDWLAEDIAAGPGLTPHTDAFYAAFRAALSEDDSDTARYELGAPIMVARARERSFTEELERQPSKTLVVAWLVAGVEQRENVEERIVSHWEAGDDKARAKLVERLKDAAKVGDLEHNEDIHRLLTNLELAEPPAGDAGAQIAEAWIGFVAGRERNGLPHESPQLTRLLADRPVLLKSLAGEHLGKGTAPLVFLRALEAQTEDWPEGLLIEHAASLLATEAHEQFWDTLAAVGGAAARAFAVEMWREGEPHIASAIRLLAVTGEEPEIVTDAHLEDIESAEAAEEAAEEEADEGVAPMPRHLWLKCNDCNAIGRYPAPTIVYVPPQLRAQLLPPEATEKQPELIRWDGVFTNRPVRCKWCDERDNYWTTLTSQIELQRYLGTAPRETTQLPEQLDMRRGVFIGRVQSQDGLIVTRPSMLLDDVEAILEEDDEKPENWRRVGFARANLGLFEESREAYQRAAELDPKDLSSVVSLTALAMRSGDMEGLRDALGQALERVIATRSEDVPEEARRAELTGILNALFGLREEELALWVRWQQELEGQEAQLADAVALSRIGDWNKVGSLMLDPNILELKLVEDVPPPGGHLERVLAPAGAATPAAGKRRKRSSKGGKRRRKVGRKRKKR